MVIVENATVAHVFLILKTEKKRENQNSCITF